MSEVIGFLVKQSEKPTKNGGTIYNICVEVEGKDEWFGYGFDAPHFGVDSEIEFDVEVNGEFENVIVKSLVVNDMQNEPAAAPAKGGRGGSKRGAAAKPKRTPRGGAAPEPEEKPKRAARGGAKAPAEEKPATRAPRAGKADVDWDRKDNLIRLQSCQNTAVATVNLAVAAGALTLPAKKGAKFDALQALIEKEAHRLFLKYDACADDEYDHDADIGAEEEGADGNDDDGIPE